MSVLLECDRCGAQEQTSGVMLFAGLTGPSIPTARPELPDGWTRPTLPHEDGSAWDHELCPQCKTDLIRFMAGEVDERGGTESIPEVPGCLFCHPGTSDNETVARGAYAYARLDNYPAADGHLEIVPLRHVESFFDLTPAEIGDMHVLLGQVTSGQRADGWTLGVNEGRAAGRTIDHVHIHVIPRRWGDVQDPRGGVRHVLPGTNPDQWAATAARVVRDDSEAASRLMGLGTELAMTEMP